MVGEVEYSICPNCKHIVGGDVSTVGDYVECVIPELDNQDVQDVGMYWDNSSQEGEV